MLSIIRVLVLNSGISVLSGYLCSIAVKHHDLRFWAGRRDKGQSEREKVIRKQSWPCRWWVQASEPHKKHANTHTHTIKALSIHKNTGSVLLFTFFAKKTKIWIVWVTTVNLEGTPSPSSFTVILVFSFYCGWYIICVLNMKHKPHLVKCVIPDLSKHIFILHSH